MDNKGFTLIELVMLITILAVLAAVSVPRFGEYYGGIKQDNATIKIASDIRYSQNRATTTQQRSRVRFVNPANYEVYYCATYSSATCSCTSGWALATDPSTGGNFQVNLNSDFSGVTVSSTVSNLEFDSLGRPYDGGGSCNNSAGATVTVQYSGLADKTITVQTQTGMVSY